MQSTSNEKAIEKEKVTKLACGGTRCTSGLRGHIFVVVKPFSRVPLPAAGEPVSGVRRGLVGALRVL